MDIGKLFKDALEKIKPKIAERYNISEREVQEQYDKVFTGEILPISTPYIKQVEKRLDNDASFSHSELYHRLFEKIYSGVISKDFIEDELANFYIKAYTDSIGNELNLKRNVKEFE